MSSVEDTRVEQESPVPGFRMEDFSTTCPTTGEACPVQENLVYMYVGNVTEDSDGMVSLRDRTILTAKLSEYKLAGRFVSCDDTCSVREAMNASEKRTKAVGVIRGLRNLFK